MSQLLRVQNFCVSMDGFGAGAGQSLEAPFGHATAEVVASPPPGRPGLVGVRHRELANRTEPGGSEGWTTTSLATSRGTSRAR